jgi:uncharacterized membrane protein
MTVSSAAAREPTDLSAAVPAPGSTSSATPIHASRSSVVPAPTARGGPWLMAALILAGAAQLITISLLTSSVPLAATWASVLLATAPAPLTAAAAYVPTPASLLFAVAALGVMVAGLIGVISHAGPWFLPAVVILAIGIVMLWRERSERS